MPSASSASEAKDEVIRQASAAAGSTSAVALEDASTAKKGIMRRIDLLSH